MGSSVLSIRLRYFASKLYRLTKLSTGLGLLAFVVLTAINLLSSEMYPTFYGKADREVIFIIAHITYLLGILISPILVAFFGCKSVLIFGAVEITVTLISLIWPVVAAIYIVSVMVGFAVAFVTIGGYTFVSTFSEPANVSRNAALIYTTIELSQLLSNTLLYFCFGFLRTRHFIYWACGALLLIAIIAVVLIYSITSLPPPKCDGTDDSEVSGRRRVYRECVQFMKFTTKTDLLLLTPMFFYTGILLALLQGNYGTWPAFTIEVMKYGMDFGTCCSLTITTSEVVCGIVLILMGIEIEAFGRATTAAAGFILQGMACFFLIGLVPKDGSFTTGLMSEEMTNSTITLIIVMAVLLGSGVALTMIQMYAKLMETYHCAPAAVVTIFKAVQAIGVFSALYYSRLISLPYQSTISLLIGLFSTFCFIFLEHTRQQQLPSVAGESESNENSNRVVV